MIPLTRETYHWAPLGDLFHESVPFEWIERVFELMRECRQHTFQALTKRIDRVSQYWEWRHNKWFAGNRQCVWPDNVWLGVTVCNQAEADAKIPQLLATPAAVRFVSIEPMLGPVVLHPEWFCTHDACRDWGPVDCDNLDCGSRTIHWVIVGGESGPGARPMHPDWGRDVRDQCASAGVPVFFKQWGEWAPCRRLMVSLYAWEHDKDRQIVGFRGNGPKMHAWGAGDPHCTEVYPVIYLTLTCRVCGHQLLADLEERDFADSPDESQETI